MEEKMDFSTVPYEYAMCLNHQCPQANTCLRQVAAQEAPDSKVKWVIISPKHLATVNDLCPYYRSSTKVSYAKGFIKMLENLPHRQMQIIISRLMNRLGRRTYYRVRKGERLLSPDEQQMVLNILKDCGASSPGDFDAYVKDYDW